MADLSSRLERIQATLAAMNIELQAILHNEKITQQLVQSTGLSHLASSSKVKHHINSVEDALPPPLSDFIHYPPLPSSDLPSRHSCDSDQLSTVDSMPPVLVVPPTTEPCLTDIVHDPQSQPKRRFSFNGSFQPHRPGLKAPVRLAPPQTPALPEPALLTHSAPSPKPLQLSYQQHLLDPPSAAHLQAMPKIMCYVDVSQPILFVNSFKDTYFFLLPPPIPPQPQFLYFRDRPMPLQTDLLPCVVQVIFMAKEDLPPNDRDMPWLIAWFMHFILFLSNLEGKVHFKGGGMLRVLLGFILLWAFSRLYAGLG